MVVVTVELALLLRLLLLLLLVLPFSCLYALLIANGLNIQLLYAK